MHLLVFVYLAVQIIAIKGKVIYDDLLPKLRCHRSDPNIKSCLTKEFDEIVHNTVKNGSPQYNIPIMDPVDIPLLPFEIIIDDLTNIKGTIKNLKIIGLSNFAFIDAKFKDDGKNILSGADINHPHNYLNFELSISGKLFGSPINIDGSVKLNFTDVTTRFKMGIKTITRGAVKYFALNDFKLRSTAGDSHIAVALSDPQYQALVDFATNSFNSNPKQFIDFIHPFYAETAENLVGVEIKKLLSAVPAETLLPE